MPTKKRAPRMSEEELAADAAAFAQAAMQEDAEAASDDAGDDCAVNAGADTDADKWPLWRKPLRGNLRRLFLFVDWEQT